MPGIGSVTAVIIVDKPVDVGEAVDDVQPLLAVELQVASAGYCADGVRVGS